jgi:predicted permease
VLSTAHINAALAGRITAFAVLRSVLAVLKTPALIAAPPALLINWLGGELPPLLVRQVELLSDGMIPVMLVALGATRSRRAATHRR